MTAVQPSTHASTDAMRASAGKHLWRHFAEMGEVGRPALPIMVRGEGCYLIDSEGNRYLDGISNLFCVNLGYGFGSEFAAAAAAQYEELGYHSSWGSTHPRAIELAEKVASLAPEGMERVFFTPSGGESVEAAWKLARQYHLARGEHRWKAIGRYNAYHGTTLGALSINGLPELRRPFEPLVPQVAHVRNTARFGRPADETDEQFTAGLLANLEEAIIAEDPTTIAMVIMEPVQNHGGCLTPPPGYPEGVRALCDKYGILLVADEVICAFGRIGAWFASERYDMRPDIITTAKGLSSSHAVIGAVIASEKVYEPFSKPGIHFTHGNTFGGHPIQAAIALKNLEIMEREGIPQHVRAKEGELGDRLRTLLDLPIVGDVRGAGYFFGIELNASRPDGTPFTPEERMQLFGPASLADRLAERGLLSRISIDGDDPVMFAAPPLVADTDEFTTIVDVMTEVLGLVGDEAAAL
ncbi:MAG: aspartate aminotransferase family protein [Solirubrobacteraceae bacterium]